MSSAAYGIFTSELEVLATAGNMIYTSVLSLDDAPTSTSTFNETTSKKLTSDAQEFLTYQNHTLGIKLSYPPDWKVDPGINLIRFYPSLTSNNNSGLFLLVYPSNGKTLENIVSQTMIGYKTNQTLDGFRLVDLNATQHDLTESLIYTQLFEYKEPSTSQNYTELRKFLLRDNTVYDFVYTEESSKFYNYLPAVLKMHYSFAFLPSEINFVTVTAPGIHTGNIPTGMAVNPNTDRLYVPNFGSNTVSVIDTNTNKAIKNITVGSRPNDVAVIPIDNSIYVANAGSNTVSVIDGVTSNVTTVGIPVGESPSFIKADPNLESRYLFVTNRDSGSVSVISGETQKKIGDITVGRGPFGLDINTLTKKIYVANTVSGTISVIDYFVDGGGTFRNNTITEIPVGGIPSDVAVDPTTNTIYVTVTRNAYPNYISVIDGSSNNVIQNLTVGFNPESIDINPYNKLMIVTHRVTNNLTFIDAQNNSIIESVNLNTRPRHIAMNPESNIAYISNDLANKVYLINQTTKKFIVGISFKVNSTDAGYIKCTNPLSSNNNNGGYSIYNNNDYAMYDLGTRLDCIAESNNDRFEFSRWSGSLSTGADDKKEISVTLDHYGTLSAYFDEIQSPLELPKEIQDTLWALMVAVIIGPIAGWLIHRAFEKIDKKRQLRYLNVYMQLIDEAYEKNQGNKQDCRRVLEEKYNDIHSLLKSGIINDSTFRLLKDRISEYLENVTTRA